MNNFDAFYLLNMLGEYKIPLSNLILYIFILKQVKIMMCITIMTNNENGELSK